VSPVLIHHQAVVGDPHCRSIYQARRWRMKIPEALVPEGPIRPLVIELRDFRRSHCFAEVVEADVFDCCSKRRTPQAGVESNS
jgi:hypothetical protein